MRKLRFPERAGVGLEFRRAQRISFHPKSEKTRGSLSTIAQLLHILFIWCKRSTPVAGGLMSLAGFDCRPLLFHGCFMAAQSDIGLSFEAERYKQGDPGTVVIATGQRWPKSAA